MAPEETEKRYAHWQLAVERSLKLAQLSAPVTEPV